jgi:hypothetical protein
MLQLNKVVNIPVHILKRICKLKIVYRILTEFLHFIYKDIYIWWVISWQIYGHQPGRVFLVKGQIHADIETADIR